MSTRLPTQAQPRRATSIDLTVPLPIGSRQQSVGREDDRGQR
jgi:hypothetical protein